MANKKSSVRVGRKFNLKLNVIEQTVDEQSNQTVTTNHPLLLHAPSVRTGHFFTSGISPDFPGCLNVLFFKSEPLHLEFTITETRDISGYARYSTLMCGSVACGIVFHLDRSRTIVTPTKISVKGIGSSAPSLFSQNFELEKMGVLVFVSKDSSTLIIPSDVNSHLVVRVE